jgi:hypothetical protein
MGFTQEGGGLANKVVAVRGIPPSNFLPIFPWTAANMILVGCTKALLARKHRQGLQGSICFKNRFSGF